MGAPSRQPDPPFVSGAPHWHWLGGRPAIDLVNTRCERHGRSVEWLVDDADVVRWLRAARLLDAEPAAGQGLADATRALRDAIDAGVRAAVGGTPMPAAAVALVDGWLLHAGSRPRLVAGADGVPRFDDRTPADSPLRALGAVALDAARLLGRADERARVRICASPTCSTRFYDRSAAARRRWCAMALCGNTAKARRFRQRAAPS
jgi:predicted RNA-binding Zn ribbon-like protein